MQKFQKITIYRALFEATQKLEFQKTYILELKGQKH